MRDKDLVYRYHYIKPTEENEIDTLPFFVVKPYENRGTSYMLINCGLFVDNFSVAKVANGSLEKLLSYYRRSLAREVELFALQYCATPGGFVIRLI